MSDRAASPPESVHRLASAATGAVLTVCRLEAHPEDGTRLKRMGICEGRRLQLVQDGDPLIVRVVGCRVAISRQLAGQVWVQTCTACPE